jgi:hypothetical protein
MSAQDFDFGQTWKNRDRRTPQDVAQKQQPNAACRDHAEDRELIKSLDPPKVAQCSS